MFFYKGAIPPGFFSFDRNPRRKRQGNREPVSAAQSEPGHSFFPQKNTSDRLSLLNVMLGC